VFLIVRKKVNKPNNNTSLNKLKTKEKSKTTLIGKKTET